MTVVTHARQVDPSYCVRHLQAEATAHMFRPREAKPVFPAMGRKAIFQQAALLYIDS
jgi:hypothetical protein